MSSRHYYLHEQRKERPNCLLVDNGNVSDEEKKLSVVLKIMSLDDYDAVGTGSLDIQFANAYAKEAREMKVPLVRAVPRGDALDPIAQPLQIKTLKGHKLGVTSAAPAPDGQDPKAYLDKLAQALVEMRGKCDFLVLLSQLSLDEDRDLARRCGSRGPNAIIPNLDGRGLATAEMAGSVYILPTGAGGIRVGTADVVFPRWGSDPPKLENISVPLGKGDSTDPTATELVSKFFENQQAEFAKGVDPALLKPDPAPPGGDAQVCGKCHEMETASWRRNRHATAFMSLIEHKRMVPECITCHSSRFAKTHVLDRDARAGAVDCTACHPIAAGGQQSRCPKKATATQGEKTCLPCHTAVNSPHFDYTQYLARIRHQPVPNAGPALSPPKVPPATKTPPG